MRNAIAIVFAAALLGACTQKTETSTSVDSTGTVTSTSTESTTMPAIDTAAVHEATDNAAEATRDAAGNVREAARDAAHKTGTALEEAGKEIQERTRPEPAATDTTRTTTR